MNPAAPSLCQRPTRLGVLPANRGFFDSALAASMRAETLEALAQAGIEAVVPDEAMTRFGCVESIEEAERCARLFREKDVDGIVVVAVNFGDEQGVAWTLKTAALNVPVLLFACQEEGALSPKLKRRDAFCGLLSIGEVLRQLGVAYSVAPEPIGYPRDPAFAQAARWFAGVCRVTRGVRSARYGQIGARPDAFWTCRFDEARLQRLGPTTVTLDLSEVVGAIQRMSDDDPAVLATLQAIENYGDVSSVPAGPRLKMAKLETFLRKWGDANRVDAYAIQCWTAIQQQLGVCSCTSMSRLTDAGRPAACEADVLGALSMHALQLATGRPAALADWNNLHHEDPDLVNLWHCGVFPASFSEDKPVIGQHSILPVAGACPPEDAEGVVNLVAAPAPATLCRVTADPETGWKCLVAEGAFESHEASTVGSYGWCRIPGLIPFYRDTLLRHFPHHVAVVPRHAGSIIAEAFGRYLGMDVFTPARSAETPAFPLPPL